MANQNDIPTFAPPAQTFTPPSNSARSNTGPVCYYHNDEPAVAKCAKCGKFLCKDCFDSYGVSNDEYAGQALCYDCCHALVADNVKTLKKQKAKIIAMYVFTLIGMIFGAIIGAGVAADGGAVGGEAAAVIIIWAFICGCFWTFIKNVFLILGNTLKNIAKGAWLGAILWFFIDMIKAIFLAVWGTIQKLFYYTKHLIKTSGFIKSDTAALQNMQEYMEYTLVRSQNKGVDLETLMGDNSVLANNSFARIVQSEGEDAAEASIRNCVASINENGEIIRSFAA